MLVLFVALLLFSLSFSFLLLSPLLEAVRPGSPASPESCANENATLETQMKLMCAEFVTGIPRVPQLGSCLCGVPERSGQQPSESRLDKGCSLSHSKDKNKSNEMCPAKLTQT